MNLNQSDNDQANNIDEDDNEEDHYDDNDSVLSEDDRSDDLTRTAKTNSRRVKAVRVAANEMIPDFDGNLSDEVVQGAITIK